ncbi:MBOAT family protein [PVC group bacterium]|nr:MBOAT family protein [PVC group bacterium]
MVFSSLVFLCIFLPVVLLLYYLTPQRYRNYTALAASLFFYAWGAPRFVFVLIGSSIFDYLISHTLIDTPKRSTQKRKFLLGIAIAVNLSFFIYFKYMNFFIGQTNSMLGLIGADGIHWTHIALPIGISFFTFQKLSYLVDVYRGTSHVAESVSQHLLYVALFPQLIAGPIVRYHDVAKQLISRKYSAELFLSGAWRFALGLAKKVLIANVMGKVADTAFGIDATLSPLSAWIGAVCYAFQIYFDFSGYSDMAIGLGRMLGLHFLENFNFPYISTGFAEFWRRWHISLSNWMREYLYIPLGGNRVKSWRVYFNLWLVFLLSGFWHGASWNFIVWGCYHGLFISIDRLMSKRSWRFPRFISIPTTFLLVLIGWIFFRAETLPDAFSYLHVMFAGNTLETITYLSLKELMPLNAIVVLVIAVLMSLAPLIGLRNLFSDWDVSGCTARNHTRVFLRFALTGLLFLFSLMALTLGHFNPFIYFRF